MSEDNTNIQPVADEPSGLSVRRKVLKTGAALIPAIITMHALPPSAGTDYTNIAYRYGNNAGLCRNPRFNPRASGGPRSEEFIPCSEVDHRYKDRDRQDADDRHDNDNANDENYDID